MKFLFKANDDVISHCKCVGEPAQPTAQLDCPWCGCGWMIPCSKCGKSFVFGVIREMEMPIIEVGKRVEELRGIELEPNEMLAWAESMAETFASFDVGDIVVCLDGTYLRFDSTDIEFDGYFAHHELERLPHAEALENSTRLEAILGNKKYWFDRELPDRERD